MQFCVTLDHNGYCSFSEAARSGEDYKTNLDTALSEPCVRRQGACGSYEQGEGEREGEGERSKILGSQEALCSQKVCIDRQCGRQSYTPDQHLNQGSENPRYPSRGPG